MIDSKLEQQYRKRLIALAHSLFPRDKSLPLALQGEELAKEAFNVVREVLAASGACERCWGKGYASQIVFASGRRNRVELPRFKACTCERGKSFAKVITHVKDEVRGAN